FDEAITAFRKKARIPTKRWTDIYANQHGAAFMVAGASTDALLADFQSALLKAQETGTTLADFRKNFDKIVDRHGWSYKGKRGWRTRIIYETNLRQSYNAGRYAKQQEIKKEKPYLRYVAVLDGNNRPEHKAWHGTILPQDHVFWDMHTPQNGWNCRCSTQAISKSEARGFGKRVKDMNAPSVENTMKQIHIGGGKKQIVTLPKGIDPGFEGNAGKASFGEASPAVKAIKAHQYYKDLPLPHGNLPNMPDALPLIATKTKLLNRIRGEVTAEKLQRKLKTAIGGDDKIFADPIGGKVTINAQLATHLLASKNRLKDRREQFFSLIPELIEKPSEIWVNFAQDSKTGKVIVRKRYVTLFKLENNHTLIIVADKDNHHWSALTIYERDQGRHLNDIRKGLRLYQK
nr:minor capsid protein [Alphaproteobacteria bacterium]